MAKAVYEFSPDIAFTDAARQALLSGFHKMMDNADGTRDGLKRKAPTAEDIEALHDMRVGSRRVRAALSVFAKVFPRDEFRALDKQIGAITDALGAVRDLDVQLDYLRTLHASLPENEAYGIGRLIARQTKKRNRERKALLNALDTLKKKGFARSFRRTLSRALPKPKTSKASAATAAE